MLKVEEECITHFAKHRGAFAEHHPALVEVEILGFGPWRLESYLVLGLRQLHVDGQDAHLAQAPFHVVIGKVAGPRADLDRRAVVDGFASRIQVEHRVHLGRQVVHYPPADHLRRASVLDAGEHPVETGLAGFIQRRGPLSRVDGGRIERKQKDDLTLHVLDRELLMEPACDRHAVVFIAVIGADGVLTVPDGHDRFRLPAIGRAVRGELDADIAVLLALCINGNLADRFVADDGCCHSFDSSGVVFVLVEGGAEICNAFANFLRRNKAVGHAKEIRGAILSKAQPPG